MKGSLIRALLLVLIFSSLTYGQMSFDFCGGGARAEGMGKAYLAVSDDVTGGSWNPAGIYDIDKPVISLSWASLAPRGGATSTINSFLYYHDHTGSLSNIGSINFAAPVRIKGHPFVGSFNYTRNFDVYQNFGYYFEGEVWISDLFSWVYIEQTAESKIDGGVNSVNIGFGTRLYQNVSLGASMNVYTGKTLFQQATVNIMPEAPWDAGRQVAYIEEYTTLVDTNKFSGMNFTLGLKYSGEKLAAALILRTPFQLAMDYDRNQYHIVTVNGLVFDGATDTTYFMDNLVKYDMPWMVGLGLARRLTENLLVAGDVEARAFKGGKVNVRESITINPGGDNEEAYIEFDPRWNNVVTFRLGAEYMWQTGLGQVPLRAGAGYCPIPESDVNALGERSTAAGYRASLGTGIHWEQIKFDLAYSVSTIDRSFEELDFTNRNHHLNISFTGVF